MVADPVVSPGGVSVHLIGISGYARAVLESLQNVLASSGGKLVSATVINRHEEEGRCRELEARGCRVYQDHELMLAGMGPGPNLCIVPTSIFLHAPMTISAVKAGAHVLVEKPLAGSTEDAIAMVHAGLMFGRSIAVGFQDMYAPQVREIKTAITQGEIGRVSRIRITASWPRGAAYYARNSWAGRRFCNGQPVSDSPLSNAFAHFVNLALFFSGRQMEDVAEVVSVSGRLLRFFPIETFDTAQVVFQTADGVDIECCVTHADTGRMEPSIEVLGDRGSLCWQQEEAATLRDQKGDVLRRWTLDNEETNRRRMLARVIQDTLAGSPPLCSAGMSLPHVEAFELAGSQLSIEDGRRALELEPLASSPWTPVPGLMIRLIEESLAAGN